MTEVKCLHCGSSLGSEPVSVENPELVYIKGDIAVNGESVFGEEVIVSLKDLRCVVFYYAGSQENGTVCLTYTSDDSKIYFRGLIANRLFQVLKEKCKGVV